MNTAMLNQINQQLKSMPDNLLEDVLAFLAFLNFKRQKEDWYQQLTDNEIELVTKGQQDLDRGNTYSHQEAMDKVNDHIRKKYK